eukprot:TRINITY_DN20500_c8_g1_i1.p1 TRINITY_DN20500_c8_g1~~TRINITY_DN20500_c8_g1_i1.p1  ORF type:complete len:418 (-),score=35.97 TRINITY_DN20500_c8_g1_i1:310-1467(-)
MSGVSLSPGATVSVNLRTDKPSPNGFVILLNDEQLRASILPLLHRLPRQIQIEGNSYLPCAWRGSLADPLNVSHKVLSDRIHSYALGVLQARPGSVTGLAGEVGFMNPGGSHLPAHEEGTAECAHVMACLFLASTALLALLTVLRWRSRTKLHLVVFGNLFSKVLMLTFLMKDMEVSAKSGKPSAVRTALWQLLRQFQQVMAVLVFFVIGLGWKVMRPNLRNSEWAFGGMVSLISFLLGTLEVACTTFGSCNPQRYLLTQFTVHSLCFLVVIIATNFNVFVLQRQITEARASPEVSGLYSKLHSYSWFRGFFLYFVIIPTVVSTLTLHSISFRGLWVVRETSEWIVFTGVMWLFRPGSLSRLKVFELAVVDNSDGEDGDADSERE